MVAHDDEKHPNLHVIVNVINPDTGIKNPMSKDWDKLQSWALHYEKERGQNLCPKRQENADRRLKGEWVKYQEKQNTADYHRWQREQTTQAIKLREHELKDLSEEHKQQHRALYQAKEQLVKQKQAELKEEQRRFWAATFQQQRAERQDLEIVQATAWGRLKYFVTQKERFAGSPTRLSVKGLLSDAFEAISSSEKAFADLDRTHAEQKKVLSDRANDAVRTALKDINVDYRAKRDQLEIMQRQELDATKKAQIEESKKRARDIASGKSRAGFDELKTADEKRADLKAQLEKTKDEITHDTEAEKKKKRTDTFRAFRETKEEITEEKDTDRDTGDGGKSGDDEDTYRVFRDADDRGRERDPERKRSDDDDEEGSEDSGEDDDDGFKPPPTLPPKR